MDLYSFLVLFVLIALFVVILPLISGIGTFKVEKPQNAASTKGKSGVKFKLSKKSDKELTFGSSSSANGKEGRFDVDSKTGLKKRVIGKFDEDPNNYDYDVNELINEDRLEEQRQQAQRLKKFEGSKEKAYEELV